MDKILVLNNCIEMTTQSDSTMCAILATNEKTYSWIMNHYIFMWQRNSLSNRKIKTLSLMPLTSNLSLADECPYLEQIKYDYENIISGYGSFVNFLIEMINNNWYVVAVLDQFYINNFEGEHYRHKNFIIGYDDKKEIIYMQDHFDNGKLSQICVSFENIEKAFSDKDFLSTWFGDFIITTVRLKNISDINEIYKRIGPYTEIYKNEIIYAMSDMYNCLPIHLGQKVYESQLPCTDGGYYGLNVYIGLMKKIEDSEYIDCRDITTIKNTNSLMIKRIDFFRENKIMDKPIAKDIFERTVLDSGICLGLALKYNLTKESSLKEKIVDKFMCIKNNSEIAYKMLLGELTNAKGLFEYIYVDSMY